MTISDLRKTDNFFLLAGPCVIEGEEMALRIADRTFLSAAVFLMPKKLTLSLWLVNTFN